jgi:S1-C subfamily serine protease
MQVVDLDLISQSVVKLRAVVPEDAFTAGILGSERMGNGVVVNSDGLILTIGYLVTEATDVWLTTEQGLEVAGHPFAYDYATGFGLVLPLQNLNASPIPFGSSAQLGVGDEAYVVSCREFAEPKAVRVLARREFAGAWEYLLEDAIFASPAHSHWSGAALIDRHGMLVGLGSLFVREMISGEETNANMFVPTDLLQPILEDMSKHGRAPLPPRPWLGLYAVEVSGKVYVTGVVDGGPAQKTGIREGDVISQVDEHYVGTLPDFYRRLWALGPAGVSVGLTTHRSGTALHLNVRSMDRSELLKRPQAH